LGKYGLRDYRGFHFTIYAILAEEQGFPDALRRDRLRKTSIEKDWRKFIEQAERCIRKNCLMLANFTELKNSSFWDAWIQLGFQAIFTCKIHNPNLKKLTNLGNDLPKIEKVFP